ncbi:MAG TPA: signal recognition particle-docking protein FtsY [Armatimonadota bacterium]|jgi:fused signal recognition particle receptor
MLKWFKKIDQMLTGRGRVDEELLEELEESLIQADVNVRTAGLLLDALRKRVENDRLSSSDDARRVLREEIQRLLEGGDTTLRLVNRPAVVLLVGVNGTGKTTSLAKLARRLTDEGKSVLVAAGDTFRAAAIEQLEEWASRIHVPVVRHQMGGDPSAVVFDAISAAKARGTDVLLIDTAGRLHTKGNLMEELKKIGRVVERELGRPADETLLVLDATTGQNALSQAELFSKAVPVTGLILTKTDGTAKGGIALTLRQEMGVPIKLIGVGEKAEDLRSFDARSFVDDLFS